MNLDTLQEQKITGSLVSTDNSEVYENITGICVFNKYDLSESYIYFHIEPSWNDFIFELTSSDKLILQLRKGFDPTYFDILEAHIQTKDKSDITIFESGCISDILYFHKEINYDSQVVKRKKVPENYQTKDNEYFYTLESNKYSNFEEADLIFLMLSTMMGNKFFARSMIHKSGKIIYRHRLSNRKTILLLGSGRKMFPIEFDQLSALFNSVDKEHFRSVLLLYTTFCVTDSIRDRLIQGCGLLDYLLDLFYITNKVKIKKMKKSGLLFQLLREICSQDKNLSKYISGIFKVYPSSLSDLKVENKYRKYDFFDYRDRFLHRGDSLRNLDQIKDIEKSIFNLNEILRIIILNFNLIGKVEFEAFPIIESCDMRSSIDLRRKLISKYW